jgi:hypothetical protein
MSLKIIIISIFLIEFNSIALFSEDFNYLYWLNSYTQAVEKFKNHFFNDISVKNFENINQSNIQIKIVPYLRIIDTTNYYKPKNKKEFYNSIGIDTSINYVAYLKFDNIYSYLVILDGKLVYKGRSDEDDYYSRMKCYFDNQNKLFVNVIYITQGSIIDQYFIDTDDLRIHSKVFKSRIDTNKTISLYEYLKH